MTKSIENLVLPLVNQEIEKALDTYPSHPYHEAFANPDLRVQLASYVLNRVPVCYGLVEQSSPLEENRVLVPHPVQQRLREAVHDGIQCILERNCEWVSNHIPHKFKAEAVPSSWFG
ncbi:hypothetical protein [Leptolyngbya sp. FACHB-261]|uniref:hypothetical protein n=1 Tax=Leptolyngbya sp. FACHB-261 TaxID=2692806 RepID=UPI00168236FA|nr:hypothetical protein [Leptolyngbya sp. FACHB-261]MBD2102986.1 hypothetical protein [Leptolyngbya sp. FACHB-261]